jgi:hypothetical protein
MTKLKHPDIQFLKLDCEGCEWVALQTLFQGTMFPQHLWFELHAWEGHMHKAFGNRTWTFAHSQLALLASPHYGVAVVEHNPGCAACAEFLLIRE